MECFGLSKQDLPYRNAAECRRLCAKGMHYLFSLRELFHTMPVHSQFGLHGGIDIDLLWGCYWVAGWWRGRSAGSR